jgi:hypothetical protein
MGRTNYLRAWHWEDQIVVARTKKEAVSILKDRYDGADFRRYPVRPADGEIEYCNEEGEIIGSVDGANVESVWSTPCIVPEFA